MIREGENFIFFETNGKTVGYFESVHNLHMNIETLNKILFFYDMKYVFAIIQELTIQCLKIRLDILFGRQTDNQKVCKELADNPLNDEFITSAAAANSIDKGE